MDRLAALQLFTRIVELNSFSQAADTLGIPRATATHAIKSLEARLQVRLLERSTRHVRPTLDGNTFYKRCVQILSDLDNAESSLRHIAINPRGILHVGMHGIHAAHIVLPEIDTFHTRYPDIELVISSGDRLANLIPEGIDCVIRAGEPRDSSLAARRLAVMPQLICASPRYLRRFGTPTHPDQLASHQAVRFFASSGASDYPVELFVGGQRRSFETGGWLSVNDAGSYVSGAMQGCGLIQLPRFHVEDALLDGDLVEVLKGWKSPDMPVSALYPHQRQLSQRVRVFIDWLSPLYEKKFGPLSTVNDTAG
ncbi:LysR family transcriptional regulator [Erwinia oleae]|uniref:LysR substrate-binding domain-containing protein n=1 Tax=Erwinia oleae TaxID=796334 RepID=UPI000556EF07|nr:LysR family transcriptional regulator [Erwinia oleae]